MVLNCSIKFDQDNNRSYHAGDVVSGNVTIQCHKPITVRGITLKVVGYAKIKCCSSCSSHITTERCFFLGRREDFIDITKYLVGFRSTDEIRMEPSVEMHKFEFTIPENCPSSFESSKCQICYCVQVELSRPWQPDKTYHAPFTVLNKVDLNRLTRLLRLPVHHDIAKQFACHPCRTPPLTLSVFLPQRGYSPGQFITVTVKVNNPTSVQIRKIRISINAIAQLSSRICSKDVIRLASKTIDSLPNKRQHMLTEIIRVPPTSPSCPTLCQIISISHAVEVQAMSSGLHTNPTVSVPITIGTVALLDSRDGRTQPVPYENEMEGRRENLI